MNHVGLPLPVVQILRRLFNVISSLSISNQYLLVRKSEAEAAAENHKVQKSSLARWGNTRTVSQALWATKEALILRLTRSIGNEKIDNCGDSDLERSLDLTRVEPDAWWRNLRMYKWPSIPALRWLDGRSLMVADLESAKPDYLSDDYSREGKDQMPSPSPTPPSRPSSPPERPQIEDDPDFVSPIHCLLHHPALFNPVRKPRYPIVLCHGLYGFDVRGPSSFPRLQMHYWSNVLQVLKNKIGAEVIVTGVPGTGSIASRAERMNRFLQERVRGRAINLLAHSMGGLDCRHLITHCQPEEYTPISLTTISTPHRGSPFMDWCTANIGIGKPRPDRLATASSDPDISRPSATVRPPPTSSGTQFTLSSLPSSFTTLLLSVIDSPAYSNLTTTYLENVFNPSTPDDPRVKYYSIAARTEAMSVWHPLWLPKMVLDGVEERERAQHRTPPPVVQGQREWERDEWGNDGLVSVRSAKWGEFLGTLEGCDHWEIRGARGLTADLANPLANSMSSGWSWRDWGRFVGAWKEEKKREGKEVDIASGDQRDYRPVNAGEGDEVVKSSTDKLSAVVDWIVNQVPSTSPKPTAEAAADRVSKDRRPAEPTFDLERFYVALTRSCMTKGSILC